MESLEKTLKTLDWLVLGLAVQKTQLYQVMNLVLIFEYDTQYPLALDEKGQAVVSVQRKREERSLLRRYKKTYDGFKEPFRADFVKSLQELMAIEK